ncbi:MAG: dephospho-CoA kinase [Burkholderiaceae bacterium]|nr:dephospho-CoA kinase [Burkholderiaceae bacterium]
MTSHTRRIGLTGGIGSGKSTAAAMFADLGASVIDADAISRSVTAPHGSAIAPIKSQFGASFIHADGSLNRERMRDLIFADAHAKQCLENIIHPLIKLEIQRRFQTAEAARVKLVVYDVPLLVESGYWRQVLDRVVVIDCTPETQIERVIARSALKREAVEKIMASQSSRLARLKAADVIIFNENITVDQLRQEVNQVTRILGL